MSKVLPILFNAEMIRAILAERKIATRRIAKGIRPFDAKEKYWNTLRRGEWTGPVIKERMIQQNAPYQPGDILYVRETWFYEQHMERLTEGEPDLPNGEYSHRYIYKADDPDYPVNVGVGATGWKPSIHMPKAAARIWLKVTDVRVERLQDMRLDDFLNEGIIIRPEAFNDPENAYMQGKTLFIKVWNSTIKKKDLDRYGWEANPWVWVIEFERCEKPESEERSDEHGR